MITSLTNPQIKHVAALQNKHRYREEQGQFVAEGIKMVSETPEELLERIYISETFVPDRRLTSWLEGKKTETVSEKVFRGLSMTQTPQGILALVRMPRRDVKSLLKKSAFLILESIQDPGNLGTMVRTAEGAGVDAIFMSKTCVDIYNPKVVRSTMGSLYRVPFVYVDDLHGLLEEMKKNKITLFAAHLKGEKYYYEADLSGKCAFLIGNEANGLTWETASMADTYIKIPMSGQVESLNAAMAAGILMYDMRRQKEAAAKKIVL
ncbi:RNA methyltransferase [Catenibacillus scindens]|uniref:TrmH family RNA methyltransferase n=1 Tax=Catenibacillus scindens TaxID=673271 RepID=UPI003207F429